MRRPEPVLRVEHCQSGVRFAALRQEWAALHARSGAGPFLTWEWLYAAWRRLTPARAPRLLLAREGDGTLCGVLPLSEEHRFGGPRIGRFLGDSEVGSDYLDVLAPRGREREVGARLWSEALRGFDLLDLRDLAAGSPSLAILRALGGALGLRFQVAPRFRCPTIDVRSSFAHYLARVSRADNLRRRQRWFEAQAGFAIDVARSPAEIARALPDLFRLHHLRWQRDGGSQGITGPAVEQFHRDAACALAERGLVRLYTLRLGERALASVYTLGAGDYRAFYQSGYDPAFARHSPGLVLLARTIEDAFSEGAREYDFLRGVEPYKFEWATGERRTVAVRLIGPTLSARWWALRVGGAGEARRWAKRILPGGWVRAIQRHRRGLAT